MKCLCITGANQSDLDLVSKILQHAGMSLPNLSKRSDSLDMRAWHEQALAIGSAETESGVNPGRFMEQLASDIFLANIKQNSWGWADTRSTWLLDFWMNFDPRLYFVLVYVSPQQMLAHAISQGKDSESVAAVIDTWQAYYQQLLRFHLRNPQRSLLVDALDCVENPQALIQRCNEQWQLALTVSPNSEPVTYHKDALSSFLAHQLCQTYPQTANLQHEIAATLTRLYTAKQPHLATPSVEYVIAEYRALSDRSAKLELLEASFDEQKSLANERQAKIDELIKKQDETVDRFTQQLTESKTKITEAGQENELLLLQLHQVQEELEAYFLKHDALQQQSSKLQADIATVTKLSEERQSRIETLTKERDACAKQVADNKAQVASLTQAKTALENEKTALTQARNEQAKLVAERQSRIETLTKERDACAKQVADNKAQVASLTQAKTALENEKTALTQARNEQAKLVAERQSRIEVLTKERDAHAKQLADRQVQIDQLNQKVATAEQENELLLLQLHQVQEELEHYFLQYQDKQKELQKAEARWQRIYQRNPYYCDYEAIEILSGDCAANTLNWRLKNLTAAGRSLNELNFNTVLEQGVAGFVFTSPSEMLTRLPSSQSELKLTFTGPDDTVHQRVETLLSFAASDWDLFHTLVRLLEDVIQQPPSGLAIPTDYNVESLRNGLINLREVMAVFPATLRYDQLTFKHAQINPNYEALWLTCENLAFGDQRWPAFDFRISCALDGGKRFGYHPKLEFPEETGQLVFQNWFIESYDDIGGKLELRFALPEAMDMDVWQRISEHDQEFLSALIVRLPSMIFSAAQNANIPLERSWNDWIKLAEDIQRIYIQLTEGQ